MRSIPLLITAALLAGALGCRSQTDGTPAAGRDLLLADHATKLSFRNHVKPVPDPLGSGATVLSGEKVSKGDHQMVFAQNGGHFKVPADYRGALVLRVLVRQERRVRIAIVSGEKLKSVYLEVPAENQWCDLVVLLEGLRGKLLPGEAVNDLTLWLKPPEGVKELKAGSEFYLERISLRPE
ncbi:MAG TPA: hypothetical protein PK280_09045 [Planctomycetota bacterium]|nr:hypothetical protein [Planctomycetota bacterium]